MTEGIKLGVVNTSWGNYKYLTCSEPSVINRFSEILHSPIKPPINAKWLVSPTMYNAVVKFAEHGYTHTTLSPFAWDAATVPLTPPAIVSCMYLLGHPLEMRKYLPKDTILLTVGESPNHTPGGYKKPKKKKKTATKQNYTTVDGCSIIAALSGEMYGVEVK